MANTLITEPSPCLLCTLWPLCPCPVPQVLGPGSYTSMLSWPLKPWAVLQAHVFTPKPYFSVEDGGGWPWLGQLHWHADLWSTWCYRVSFPYHLSWMPCPARILSDVITMVSLTAGHSDLTSGTSLFSISVLFTGSSPTKRPLCPSVTMGSGIHPLYKLMPACTKTLRDNDKGKMIWLLGLTARCQIGLQLLAL